MKKFLAALLALSLTFGSVALPAAESGVIARGVNISASAEPYGDFEYDFLDDGTLEITKYTGESENVVIPSTINGEKVTSIKYFAFRDCTNLVSVTIPSSVTKIGGQAFENCTSLTSVTIANGVTNIDGYAFINCTSLVSIKIPSSVTKIGDSVFSGCTKLANITVDSGNKYYSSENGILFNKNKLELLVFPNDNSIKEYTIPNSVTSIGDYSFDNCSSLTSITIPNSVTNIGSRAFSDCKSLANLTIAESVKSIGIGTFAGCTSLKNVRIPDSVTSIGESVFNGCTGLTSITIGNGVTTINDNAFSRCTSLTSVTIPDSVTSIGIYAFTFCSNLKSVTIPNSVTSIGWGAFQRCTNLTSITIPDSVTNIDEYAFDECSNLENVTIGKNVTSLGEKAFESCSSLTSIKIPASVTSIDYTAFWECSNLQDIIVDSNNKNYSSENGVLFNKDKSKLVVFPMGIQSEEYTIPDSVNNIGNYAFYKCLGLKSITISNSVTTISDHAFDDCYNLVSVAIPDSVTTLGSCAFDSCYNLTSITIPNRVTSIDSFTFYNCFNLESVIIPDSVTMIGWDAFHECSNLKDVYYTGSANDWAKIEIDDSNVELENANIHYNYDPNHTHSYTSSITKQPTCTAEGIRTFKCNCGDTYTETIPAKGHTAVTDKAVPATCTTNGKTAGSHCSVCGKVIKAQTVIKAKGHKSSNWIVDKPAAIGVKGSKHKECTVCHKVLEKAEIPALSETDISSANVTLSTTSYTYNGKAKKPTATVTLNGKTLKKDVDYTVKYSSNTAIGKAKVTISGKGNYKGTVSKTFKILPAKQTIAKLTAQKKGFALTWTKDKNVTGYQIQYDVKSDLKSAKSAYVKSNTTYKKTISGLKVKKTYYVRVRSYKTVGGVKYYGSWSANKKIKTK